MVVSENPVRDTRILIEKGKLEDALELLEAFLLEEPADVNLLLLRAELAIRLKVPEEVSQYVDRVLALEPNSQAARLWRALAKEHLEGAFSAVSEMMQVSDRELQGSHAAFHAARLLYECQRYEEAVVYIGRVLAMDTLDTDSQLLYAMICRKLGKSDESLKALSHVRMIDPTMLSAYIQEIDLLTELGDFDSALLVSKEARSFCGEGLEVLSRESGLFALQGDWEHVVEVCEELTRKLPDKAQPWINLGQSYLMIGRLEDSEQSFKVAIENAPNDWEPLFALANLYSACNLEQLAEDTYRASLRIAPDLWEIRNNLALLLLGKSEHEAVVEALSLLNGIPTSEPSRFEVQLNRILAMLRLDMRDNAHSSLLSLLKDFLVPDQYEEQIKKLKQEFT